MSGAHESTRASRVLRGLGAATLATFVATFFHVAAGGHTPSAATLGLTLAFASLACVALAGRRRSAWRTAVSVVSSQVLYHLLFVLDPGTGFLAPSAPGHLHTFAVPTGAMTGMAGSLGSAGTAGTAGTVEPPMWGAHLAAALFTVVGILIGERLLVALRRLPGGLRRWIGRLARVLFPLRPLVRAAPAARRSTSMLPPPPLRSLSRRGPPAPSY